MPANPQVQKFYDDMTAFQDRQDVAVDGILVDAQSLKSLIAELQARPDGWTAEDQGLLDQITSRTGSLVERLEALDASEPPPVPTPPVV